MKKILIKQSSAILMALLCFADIYSLPLTKTCYTLPRDKIDIIFREEFIYIDSLNRKDIFSFDIGIFRNTSAGFEFSLINYSASDTWENRPGDVLFNLWHYFGDISKQRCFYSYGHWRYCLYFWIIINKSRNKKTHPNALKKIIVPFYDSSLYSKTY